MTDLLSEEAEDTLLRCEKLAVRPSEVNLLAYIRQRRSDAERIRYLERRADEFMVLYLELETKLTAEREKVARLEAELAANAEELKDYWMNKNEERYP